MIRRATHLCVLLLVALVRLSGLAPLGAGEPRAEWRLLSALPAPEARQAAAADEQFFYAIDNRQIARYDRASGKRLATSTGPAEHLNSGFLLNGRLYCAHSNYPATPELSQIKALDLDSMELTTFKDFGDYGGSLTWAVRHAGNWWCNFARYGKHNRETFLVKFDDNWQPHGRWTYPPEVIARLGRHSISGGVWRDDTLLVTGHDDPLLFRLKLPAEGQVLQLIDTQPAPITGQGIADDPTGGGLVGIHRQRREIIVAAAPPAESSNAAEKQFRLRVLSYNIHHGEGLDGKLDLERIARVITSVEPDVVALQEVDQRTLRTGKVDQPSELARLTGMQVVFGGNLRYQGGDYGNAVLSCLPIARHQNHAIPSLGMNGEQRGVLEVEIKLRDALGVVRLFATHLDARRGDEERKASAALINKLAAERPTLLSILAGDLNDVPGSPTLRILSERWTAGHQDVLPTAGAAKPRRQIDYILFQPAERWRLVETRVLDEPVASDHRPILSVLELLPGEKPQ